ncbi:hypothetical protein KQX54_020063 [Cotesia glomerata]|uniref:Uncharacterized protein n=1 Tax=Cotesia glomerata TaxID=32391 RepID=A0AAV7HZM1_COTGL|nr:hypothetical protein KQX54_020063 [Cotesia glomerata]
MLPTSLSLSQSRCSTEQRRLEQEPGAKAKKPVLYRVACSSNRLEMLSKITMNAESSKRLQIVQVSSTTNPY